MELVGGLVILILFTWLSIGAVRDTWAQTRDPMDEEWLSESDERRTWRQP